MKSRIVAQDVCLSSDHSIYTSKLGVPIKTTVSATILEEALNGAVSICSLLLGQPMRRKVTCVYFLYQPFCNFYEFLISVCCLKQVDKQCAHFYSVTITKEEARAGFICRVYSDDKSKFKV